MISLTLKKGKEEPLRRRHPWVFSGAVAHADAQPEDGDLVLIRNWKDEPLAVAHFQNGSIMARVVSFDPADDAAAPLFWEKKLAGALAARRALGLLDNEKRTDCFRLAHAEGDGLPGLVIDVYGKTAVVQCHSIGMWRQKALIANALKAVFGKKLETVFDKSAESLPPNFGKGVKNGYLISPKKEGGAAAVVAENGHKFEVDWATGQKTGFFLDQRDNRELLAAFSKNKSVLNCFCYTGGFSIYALKAGAARVDSVDVSQKAIDLVEKNVERNRPFDGQHRSFCADALEFLRKKDGEQYEVVVVDPPAFAKSLDKRHNAIQAYRRLNEAAIRRAAPGGIVFTFSCSQVVDRELFYGAVTAAAMDAGRPVRVVKHLSQGGDHPVSIFHPEGSYLKGLVLLVD